MAYSCGKESSLALHRLLAAGHEAVCLITMIHAAQERSYFHGADAKMLEQYAEALSLPLIACPSDGSDYAEAFEKGAVRARALGAEAVGFGDIDIEQNRRWEEERCRHTGMQALFPLWGAHRETLLEELLGLGFVCIVKCVDTTVLPRSLSGRVLSHEAIAEMASFGIDLCGENGEYHTLVTDGPPFARPLEFRIGAVMDFGRYAVADVRPAEPEPPARSAHTE